MNRDYKKIQEYLDQVVEFPKPFKFSDFESSKYYKDDLSDYDYVKNYIKFNMHSDIDESDISEGVANVNVGNISGSGAIVSSSPSSIPGQTIGSNTVGSSFGVGGVVGNVSAVGDQGSTFGNRRLLTGKSKNKAKFKQLPKIAMGTVGPDVDFVKSGNKIKNFKTFCKDTFR